MRFFSFFLQLILSWWKGLFNGPTPAPVTVPTLAPIPGTPFPQSPSPNAAGSKFPSPNTAAPLLSPITFPTPISVAPFPLPIAFPAPIVAAPLPLPVTVPSPIAAAPTRPPTLAPQPAPEPQEILINCGGPNYVETTLSGRNRTWMADRYFVGGDPYEADPNAVIVNTDNPIIYRTLRYGAFQYEIPAPSATYNIKIHFSEPADFSVGGRVFNMNVEGRLFSNLDVIALTASRQPRTAITVDIARVVEDGAISIAFSFGSASSPIVSAIEITLVAPHLAHAVSGTGPYLAVDIRNEGRANVTFDGSTSHTHGVGLVLTQWFWEIVGASSTVTGTGATPTISVPVGSHTVTLLVVDSGGNEATERTTVTVYPFGYPAITSISPDRGSIAGNELVRITGSGFTYSADQTIVHFGLVAMTGSRQLTIVNSTTILLRTPSTTVGVPVSVTVETPLNVSTSVSYTYIASSEIKFTSAKFFHLGSVTTGTFGPDGKLYVANFNGNIFKLTLNENFTQVVEQVSITLSQTVRRTVLGIAFDPNDVGLANPPMYCSSSEFFHGGNTSSSGKSINGIIHRISGANLDVIEDIITGLPVSDHDHGLNGIIFGDSRELYISIGSNTNGGVPGRISSSQIQKENYYSAAVLVAYIHRPGFNGAISYNTEDNGTPIGGSGIEIFTSGNRNAFGITLHSNGNLYVTDNGPNLGYGAMMTGCGEGLFKPDEQTQDKLDVLVRGKYYGHPNQKRAIVDNDPRQCVWKNPTVDPPVVNGQELYKAPLLIVPSSMGGVIEYTSDYFDRQLRGNLILSRYTSTMYRVILKPDGLGVIPQSDPALLLGIGEKCLSLSEAPDGTLIDIRYNTFSVFYHKPVESITGNLKVYSVFPRRGHARGGYTLSIYGLNFDSSTSITIVGEGGGSLACPLVPINSSTLIKCTMPPWDRGSTVHVYVSKSSSGETYEFLRGFRYINGIS